MSYADMFSNKSENWKIMQILHGNIDSDKKDLVNFLCN